MIEFATMYVVVCISAGSRNPMSPPTSQLILSTTYGTVPSVTPAASQGRTLVIDHRPGGARRGLIPATGPMRRKGTSPAAPCCRPPWRARPDPGESLPPAP